MRKKATVLVFPGSNCDKEAFKILEKVGFDVSFAWHKSSLAKDVELCVIPGGFSYGDYLRSGAIAGHSDIMDEVRVFAENGGFVIGICNGFQILTESKILPGALLKNKGGHFVCRMSSILTINDSSIFTSNLKPEITLQVAHGDGMFFADEETIQSLEAENRVAFRYKDNFNGSINQIAGIIGGKNYNILGLMPHPERLLASHDAIPMFLNFIHGC